MDRNRRENPFAPTLRGDRRVAWAPPPKPLPPPPGLCCWTDCRESRWHDLDVCVYHAEQATERYYKAMVFAYPRLLRLTEPPMPADKILNPTPDEGWVYYVLVDGHYKIGYAQDVKQRMKAYPPTATLLAQHRGTKTDERNIHRRFEAHRVAGREWFRAHPDIAEYIDGVIAVHGRCVDPFVARRTKSEQEQQPVQLRRRSGIRR